MNATRVVRSSTSALPRAVAGLVDKSVSETISNQPRNLFETLSRLPNDGVGARVHQTRWTSKGIEGSYWEISRVSLRNEGTRGKAWGKLVWRGKVVSREGDERIPGVLKYMWTTGVSKGQKLPAVQPVSPEPVAQQLSARQS